MAWPLPCLAGRPLGWRAVQVGPRWAWRHGGRRERTSNRGGLLVRDPLATWGATATMGASELLDAVDRAERSRSSSHALWERLSCRTQALLPDLTAAELCRALFGFHRARLRDEGLLEAACEAVRAERPGRDLSAGDAALLLKALSKHAFPHLPTADLLLRRAGALLPGAGPADISQLLSAAVRLGLAERLGEDGPHAGLLGRLLSAARGQLGAPPPLVSDIV